MCRAAFHVASAKEPIAIALSAIGAFLLQSRNDSFRANGILVRCTR
jgi:hypothetical protein